MQLIVLAGLASIALAAADSPPPTTVDILTSEFIRKPSGGYFYNFKSEDGISKTEEAELMTVNDEDNKPHDVLIVIGKYSYVNPDGKTIQIYYSADENGFKAEGDTIPKPPAAPLRR